MKHVIELIRRLLSTPASGAAAVLIMLAGCDFSPPSSVLGEEGRVAFRSPAGLEVFRGRLVVGATLSLNAVARDDEEAALVATADIRSADPALIEVLEPGAAGATVRTIGPGETYLEVVAGDEVLDRILLRAARPVLVELTESRLAGTDVDPRLPYEFALVDGAVAAVDVVATDLCGGPLLTADAVDLASSDPSFVSVVPDADGAGPGLYGVTAGAAEIDLSIADAGVGQHVVFTVAEADIDEALLEVTAYNGAAANLWGRLFSDGLECVGGAYRWSSGSEVVVSAEEDAPTATGLLSLDGQATISDGGVLEEEAEVTVQSAGLATTVNITAPPYVAEDPGRVEPYSPPTSGSWCDPEAGQCDPYAALAIGGLVLMRRRLRRLRSGSR